MSRLPLLLCLLPGLALATPPPAAPAHAPAAPLPSLRAPGALRLQLPERHAWALGRSSETGAEDGNPSVRRGVVAGLLVGGLVGVLGGYVFCRGVETEDGGPGPFAPACSLIGGLVGAGIGAGVGALLGAGANALAGGDALEEGERATSGDVAVQVGWMSEAGSRLVSLPTPAGEPPRTGRTPNRSGPGASLRLLARLGPYVAAGPELALYHLRSALAPGGIYTSAGPLLVLGLQARGGPELGRLRPELVAGLARHAGDAGVFAASAGAALSYAVTPRFLPQLEARYHLNLEGEPDYVTLGAGVALRW